MERQIEFRGREKESREWVYGYYYEGPIGDSYIIDGTMQSHRVERKTVGQFTGDTAGCGTKIFDGDIMDSEAYPFMSDGNRNYRADVEIDHRGIAWITPNRVSDRVRGASDGIGQMFENYDLSLMKVVGNIHDHPYMLRLAGEETDQ